ncbi:flagellar protein FlgN [Heyndrickxia sp. MSNUG]|uniref:flagellar protein FlgN n=1 Tax=Heyndrickxia sp. MSNUG TaxID=3136677 RepID=UPI003C2C856B
MNIHQLIESLAKLLKLHKSLFELAIRKTGILELEDVPALTELLKEEQAHILAIEKVEAERSRIAGNTALSDFLAIFPDEERETLAGIGSELKDVMAKIKEQNALNQHLITQSLKFISFSMSLVTPPQDDYNYGPNETGRTEKGLFNSKA